MQVIVVYGTMYLEIEMTDNATVADVLDVLFEEIAIEPRYIKLTFSEAPPSPSRTPPPSDQEFTICHIHLAHLPRPPAPPRRR